MATLVMVPLLAQDRTTVSKESVGVELLDYVNRSEPDFAWSLVSKQRVKGTLIYRLSLTSQRWHENVWQHDLMVYEPARLLHQDHMLLFITGGNNGNQPREQEIAMGASLASLCGARVALLHQVPNQPLMDGRVEDDLITETWLRYLATGDTSWPLLFPMVKSAVKAMDALEAFAVSEKWSPLKGVVTAGASKRGWTSWLAPAADDRVIATAPMVIDMLNFPVQIKHQYKMWGEASEQLHDYTSKDLIPKDGVPRPGREAKLWEMMDPYSYRSRVRIPKLLIVGANDPYWTTDAMNHYWDDLVSDNSIYRGANAGHALEGKREQALSTLGVFFRHAVMGKAMPMMTWKPILEPGEIGINVSSNQEPTAAKLWLANSNTMDFRQSVWEANAMPRAVSGWEQTQAIENGRHCAVYAELVFDYEGIPFMLSTLAYCQ
jgi:PhoPQ-activated pathogenicity-related protein